MLHTKHPNQMLLINALIFYNIQARFKPSSHSEKSHYDMLIIIRPPSEHSRKYRTQCSIGN